jgi:carboxymethylenebutenolidase
MIEQTIDIPTNDGAVETFISHPERGGPHPAVFLLMDAPGIREELRDMARRLASVGYYVPCCASSTRNPLPNPDPSVPMATA